MSGTETVFIKLGEEEAWDESNQSIIPNRAMNFGDGIFETMVFDGESIRNFDLHIHRAYAGLKALKINSEHVNPAKLTPFIASRFAGKKLRIRWNLYRSGIGKYLPEENELVQTLQIGAYSPPPFTKQNAGFASSIYLSSSQISKFKTLNALPYVLAAIERKERNLDEIILLDQEGNISEAGFANIFWKKDGVVYTPSLDTGCIGGIGREVLVEGFKRLGVPFEMGKFSKSELMNSEQVWVCNALGISYLERIENTKFSICPWEILSEIHK